MKTGEREEERKLHFSFVVKESDLVNVVWALSDVGIYVNFCVLESQEIAIQSNCFEDEFKCLLWELNKLEVPYDDTMSTTYWDADK